MSETNQRTIDSYNGHIQEYIDVTPQEVPDPVKSWIDASVSGLPLDARIIEIGSAFGRDAAYIESLGYSVERTDASEGFVVWLQQHGYSARKLNAISDELTGPYDLVFADAVLLHFTSQEMTDVLSKVYSALSDNGRLSFSLKQGEGESWSEDKLGAPRFFCYWTRDQLELLLQKTGFMRIQIEDDSLGQNGTKWLHVVAAKDDRYR